MSELPPCHRMSAKLRCWLMDNPQATKADRDKMVAAARILEGASPNLVAFDLLGRQSLNSLFDSYCSHLDNRLGMVEAAKVLEINPSSLWRRAQKQRERDIAHRKPRKTRARPNHPPKPQSPQEPSMASRSLPKGIGQKK